jgi:hypothetical protein
MAIPDFKSSLQDRAYKEWFKNSVKSIFIQTTEDLRKTEQITQKTSFLITDKDIADIGSKLAGRAITNQELEKIRRDLINSVKRRKVIVRKDNSLFFPVINFDAGISTVLEKGFSSIPKVEIEDKKTGQKRTAKISDFFQKGHVFSIATNVSEQTRRNLLASKTPENVKKLFIPILDEIIKQLRADDIASSNLKSVDFDLYGKYSKNPYKYIVEMQPEKINQESGRASAPITNALRRYFDPANYTQIEKFFRTRADKDQFIQRLIRAKGSPSYINILKNNLVEVLNTGTELKTNYSIPRTKLSTEKIKVNTLKYNSALKESIKKTTKLKQNIVKAADIAKNAQILVENQQLNLISITNLINAGLYEQIKKNMGSGNRTDVLNYRTGRFAKSAKAERISESRQGMITVFYSYMKNPYATFSGGGRQQFPRSRDPKLLISKSIREIAQNLVTNRLRAVNV